MSESDQDEFFHNFDKQVRDLNTAAQTAIEKILSMRVRLSEMIVVISTSYDLNILADCNRLQDLEEQIMNDICNEDEGLRSMSKE